MKRFVLAATLIAAFAHAETATTLDYVERGLFGSTTYKLETTVYEPKEPNGRVVIFSHGSTGNHPDAVKKTIKFVNIARILEKEGYTVVVPMRKGRGNSEGAFTEETGSCQAGKLYSEKQEADSQMAQIVDQVKQRYRVEKVILMGHSRGGFLSATYAAAHPEQVSHVVDLSGTWSSKCESKSNFGHDGLSKAAAGFKKQYWVYVDNDSYFSALTFSDPGYQWIRTTAESNGLKFKQIGPNGMDDGHKTTVWKPKTWLPDVLEWLKD